MSKKASIDALIIAASNLTVAEAIFSAPGGQSDHEGVLNADRHAFDKFKVHLKRLEDENA